jgi:uncharacterized protein YukE
MGIDNIEIQNMLQDIKYQSKEIQQYLKPLIKDEYNFLTEELSAYAGNFTEYADTIATYIIQLEQEVQGLKMDLGA